MKQKIFRSMSILIIVSLVMFYILIMGVVYRQFFDGMEKEVQREARYIKTALDISGEDYLGALSNADAANRITLIDENGIVIYDTLEKAAMSENHNNRPEIEAAKVNGTGKSIRFSQTLGEQTFYYALRLNNGMIVRVANTTDSVFGMLLTNMPVIILFGIAVLICVMLLIKWQTNNIIIPINELNLEKPLENEIYEELTPLLHRIEKQNKQIDKQLGTLNKQQEEFEAITENMREGLIVLNKNAVILSVNSAALEILGITKDECIEKHILNVNRNLNIQNAVEQAILGKAGDICLEIKNSFYELMANPVHSDNEIYGCVILILDITQKQKAEQMRKEFTANVSHELKTPLMSISGYAEIIKNGLVKSEDIPEFSGRIYSEATRLCNLVEDIINLSKLDENSKMFEFEELDLLRISNDIIKRLQPQADKHYVKLKLNGESARITGVRQILDEMIYNLLDNSIKYNIEGGMAGISVIKEADRIELSVWDTGIGISREHQERIFERFYRVDKSHSRETGGTGLGLSIVKHGAIFHNADIKIDSELKRGTKIIITFKTEQLS